MALGMTACGEQSQDADYFGMKYEDIQAAMEDTAQMLVDMDEETSQYLKDNANDAGKHLIETWESAVEGEGDYQGLGELTITKTQDTITVEQVLRYANRDLIVSYIYKYNYELDIPELTDASADKVYSLGEKMEKAALNTLMGMGTVFSVLILISLVIYCFRFIPNGQNQKKTAKSAAPAPVAPVPVPVAAEEPLTDDLELVAVITAAIAASTGTAADGFVVRSIRRR